MSVQSHLNYKIPSQFSIQDVSLLRPFHWLSKGWRDLIHNPAASLAHGLIVTAIFLIALLITSRHVYVLAAVISGFMLIGPIMAAGLCEVSRQRQKESPVSFDSSLNGLSRNQTALIRFASMLLGFSVLWFFLSALVLLATVGNVAPALSETLWGDFFAVVAPMQLALYLIVGGLLACLVYVMSVVSVPAIIDNQITAMNAMIISIQVVVSNSLTMLVWASLIVLLMGISLATFLIGMIVIYPLLGHASWHAYRDLVKNND